MQMELKPGIELRIRLEDIQDHLKNNSKYKILKTQIIYLVCISCKR